MNLPTVKEMQKSGLVRDPGEGNGYPLQYHYLEKSKGRGAWRATVHGGNKESDTTEQLTTHHTQLPDLSE